MSDLTPCPWAEHEPERAYHDREWGVPVHDDRRLFEMLCLEGAQAGLSWRTILNKRAGYRRAFAGWDPAAVAGFTPADADRLVQDPGIVRHRQKIESVIDNAKAVLALQAAAGSLDAFFWGFVGGKPIVNAPRVMADLPAKTELSTRLSRELRRRGFRFVGPTTVYAFMQAVGLVNDHLVGCPRRAELIASAG